MTLAAVASVLVTASLGRWQLSRAAQKLAVQATLDERRQLPPVEASALRDAQRERDSAPEATPTEPGLQALVHRSVVLQGHWLAQHTVFLDNRQMNGRPGFFVVTPLQLGGQAEGGVVLVQRGWAPRNFLDRTQVPHVDPPANAQARVEGRLAQPPSKLFEFASGQQAQGSSRIRQNLDLPAFRAETGLDLAPLIVLQTSPADDGLRREWPVVGAGVDKHYGYAFQWFGLSGLIAVLYVWFNIFRRFIRQRSQPAA